jgi:hypothetical protein
MKYFDNASAKPAGAAALHVQIPQLTVLVDVGFLALELWRAEQAATELHRIYIRKIQEYEERYGDIGGRINPRNHEHVAIVSYTMDPRLALTAARRKVYAARRRLRNACAKAARKGAISA